MKRTLATLLILMPWGTAALTRDTTLETERSRHARGEATFDGLGDLPGGSFSSTAYDLSPDGQVVVGSGTPEAGVEAFRWQDGLMEGLGSLPGAPFQSSSAYGVSLDGSVIVGQSNSEDGFLAFRYEDDTMVGLGVLPGGTSSGAYGVSDDGLVPVGFGNGPSGLEAVRWIDGTPEGLGHLPDGNNSTSRAVSADGSVVVGQSQTQGNEEMAFRWEDGEMVGLGYLAEFGFTSWAYDVTADGAIVVGLTQSDYDGEGEGGDEAFLWQDGEMVGLGELAGGFVSSWAHGVSDDGAVVVGQSSSEENIGGEAFIWTAKDGMRSLQQVLESDHGLDLTGWTLREAIAVSADGTVIVGNGVNPDGNTEAWRASLPSQFTPFALQVDPGANGIFEPGESVAVAPTWRNDGALPQGLSGVASSFTGPEGAVYGIEIGAADYGSPKPGETASCLDTEACYRLSLDDPAVRPAPHWEATFDETLDDSDGTTKIWTLHVGESFTDVPPANLFYSSVETLLHSGVTGGCVDGEYCPGGVNSRAQMPVFVLRALEGADYVPPACVEDNEKFTDVPFDNPFCRWIEELSRRAVISGCGDRNYCPTDAVTRAQMAIFLLKTLEGGDYTPPKCTNTFDDVPCPSLFADWIEDLAAREITGGCSETTYCPGDPVSRAQMAVFVTKTFGLTLYGP